MHGVYLSIEMGNEVCRTLRRQNNARYRSYESEEERNFNGFSTKFSIEILFLPSVISIFFIQVEFIPFWHERHH